MWQLKYVYRHKDCIYTPMAVKLKILLYGYPLSNYVKGDYIYISALNILEGNPKDVEKYYSYLKRVMLKVERITSNAFLTEIKLKKNKEYYRLIYNPHILYLSPIVHRNGFEYINISSWEKVPLSKILSFLRRSKNTTYFKLLSLKNDAPDEYFLIKGIHKITPKQREIFEYARSQGYYNYPRKIDLNKISKDKKMSKSNIHEILRRAESNILNHV